MEEYARGRTLADKLWDAHVVRAVAGEPDLLYIDLHLLHEVNTPQAFDGLRAAGRTVRRPELTLATEDHATPTDDLRKPIADPVAREYLDLIRRNCAEFGIELYSLSVPYADRTWIPSPAATVHMVTYGRRVPSGRHDASCSSVVPPIRRSCPAGS